MAGRAGTADSDDEGISNSAAGDSDDIDERMDLDEFHALLTSAALRSISLEQVGFDSIGDVEPGRVMASGSTAVTVEACGWPNVEVYVGREHLEYAVPAGHAGGVEVTEFQKPAMPRCGRYTYALPDGLEFAFTIESEE